MPSRCWSCSLFYAQCTWLAMDSLWWKLTSSVWGWCRAMWQMGQTHDLKGGGGHQTLKITWKTGRYVLDVLKKVKELLRLDGSQRFCGWSGTIQVEFSITAFVSPKSNFDLIWFYLFIFVLVKHRRHLSICSGVSVELYGPNFPSMCNDYSSVKLEGGTFNVSACVSVPPHFQFQISFLDLSGFLCYIWPILACKVDVWYSSSSNTPMSKSLSYVKQPSLLLPRQ